MCHPPPNLLFCYGLPLLKFFECTYLSIQYVFPSTEIRQSNAVQQLDPTPVKTITTVWNYADNLIGFGADISNDKQDIYLLKIKYTNNLKNFTP